MSFSNLAAGESVFLDANVLVYHLTAQPCFGPACSALINQIESGDIFGFTSTHILTEVAHRLMLIEASSVLARPLARIFRHLQRHPADVRQLVQFRRAIEDILQTGLTVLTIEPMQIVTAATISQQTGLLSNDALIVAVMQAHGLTWLASFDADFDRIAVITRYEPV